MTKLKGKSIGNFINEYIKEIDNIDDLLKLCNNDCSLIIIVVRHLQIL